MANLKTLYSKLNPPNLDSMDFMGMWDASNQYVKDVYGIDADNTPVSSIPPDVLEQILKDKNIHAYHCANNGDYLYFA
jgi:hypothetical protein